MVSGIPMEEKGAAAQAGGLRLDQSEYQLRRDRRVDGTAARFNDLNGRLRCQGIGGGDHRCRRLVALRATGEEQENGDCDRLDAGIRHW